MKIRLVSLSLVFLCGCQQEKRIFNPLKTLICNPRVEGCLDPKYILKFNEIKHYYEKMLPEPFPRFDTPVKFCSLKDVWLKQGKVDFEEEPFAKGFVTQLFRSKKPLFNWGAPCC